MAFSLDNPGFQKCVSDQVDVHQMESGIMQSSGTSAASSGEPSHRSCIRCHGRMSSFSLDRHTYCYKCRGSDCDMDDKCDECMSWTKEEMEAYVKLLKSLTSKSRHCKGPHRCSGRCARFCSDSDICVAHTHSVSFQLIQVAVPCGHGVSAE